MFLGVITFFVSFVFPHVLPFYLIAISIIISVLLALYLISKIHPNRILKYIKIEDNGMIIVKNLEYQEEMREIRATNIINKVHNEVFGPEGDNIIFCPQCGKKYSVGIDFCNICGKNLRTMDIKNYMEEVN